MYLTGASGPGPTDTDPTGNAPERRAVTGAATGFPWTNRTTLCSPVTRTRAGIGRYIIAVLAGEYVPKISVEVPAELLTDLDRHVGEDGKFVNRSEAVRTSIRRTLDLLDDIDARHGRLDDARQDGD